MKTIMFFSRTCTVPGGSKVNPEGGPLHQALISRVVYHVYAEDRAIVYSGIDRGMPTNVAARRIIELIAANEKLEPAGWSFFDLRTSMHSDDVDPGDYEFHVISWRLDGGQIIVEGSATIDCPEMVYDQFDRYINSSYYADDDAVIPTPDADDDEED